MDIRRHSVRRKLAAAGGADVRQADLFSALQQLGLRLDSSRAAIDTLVIDGVQKPSED